MTFHRVRESLADRYALERELGRGGMATVYLAEDLKHKRKVAIKVLHTELASVLGPDRFLREIEIAARLQHPHILPLFDSGHAGGFLYYVMPYVEGESLRGRLVREGALPIAEAARILRDVADALGHAHARGVVHRDIKPENVMLSGRHALVTDFGVAKAVSEASGRQQLTTAGVALGTPAYMAPEQAAADPNMDHRVDVYALGVVAYELLTGRPPFEGGSPQETLAAHVTKAPQPVSTHRSTVPPMLAQLVMKCLEKRPADRCQKAEELVGQLEGFTTPSGGVTPTDTRPLSMLKMLRPSPWKWATVGVVVLTIGAAAWAWRNASTNSSGGDATKAVRLAVLSFKNLGRPQDEFFAEGMTDAIHGEIRRIPGLTVVGLQTSMQYKNDSARSLREIGQELRADYLLTARIQWDGSSSASSKVRISPELVRVSDQLSQWQESYERAYADIFALQRDIAQQVAGAIRGALGQTATRVLASSPESHRARTTTEAYTLYLKGVVERRRLTADGYLVAADYFGRAVKADSGFAAAWARLAQTYSALGNLTDAESAAWKALSLDSGSAESYTALSTVQGNSKWDFPASERNCRRALELDPNDVWANARCAILLATLGRYSESVHFGRVAADVDPLVAGDVPLYGLFGMGRYDEVISQAQAGLVLDSADSPNGYYLFIGLAFFRSARFSEALSALERARVRGGYPPWEYGWALTKAGRSDEARVLLSEAVAASTRARRPSEQGASYRRVGILYASLGMNDSAFAWLERALPYRGRRLTEARWRPEFDPLRSDPRFKEFLRKIGLEK